MSPGESIAALMGRAILCWFFLIEAYSYGSHWTDTSNLLAAKGVPIAPIVLFLSLCLIVVGSIAIFIGAHARTGALALFVITVAATVTVHDYWVLASGAARDADFAMFSRNVAIAGGLLLLIGMGSGRFGLDNAHRGRS